jgi:hypothetical protein
LSGASWRIPLFDLRLSDEDRAAVGRVLESGWLTMGPETEAFEREAAAFLRAPHAIMVSSGTAALQLALMALGPPANAESTEVSLRSRRRPVIVPAITFAATANVAAMQGHPVLIADIEAPDRPLLCPRETRRLLELHPDAIVMPVHYAGYECELRAVLRDFPDAEVVEDAAHAWGGEEAFVADVNDPDGGGGGDRPAGWGDGAGALLAPARVRRAFILQQQEPRDRRGRAARLSRRRARAAGAGASLPRHESHDLGAASAGGRRTRRRRRDRPQRDGEHRPRW